MADWRDVEATACRQLMNLALAEDLDQTKLLFAKGFVTASDVKKGDLLCTTARNEVQKASTALLVRSLVPMATILAGRCRNGK